MRREWLAALLAAVLVLSGCGNTAPGSGAPELTEEDIQAAEAAARDYYAGTVFTVEGMEYLPRGSHPFAEGECNFTVTVRKDGAAQEDRLIQLDRTETGWAVVNEGY